MPGCSSARGAECVQHTVRDIRRDGDGFVIDGEFRCRYLIGAGGTACPVHRRCSMPPRRARAACRR